MLVNEFENLINQSYSSAPKYTEISAGVPEDFKEVKTLGDLLEINYKIVSAKEQLRRNLMSKIRSQSTKYPGIIGFEDVIPYLDRAILSCHDMILVGQIGQAKTKLAQTIAENLLSPMPIIRGSITNDCPMDLPSLDLLNLLEDKENSMAIPKFYIDGNSVKKIRDNKLQTPIDWVDGKNRFKYVLATPDISVKDLVGQIDAIRITKKGTEMFDIESYSPGQLMQAKHGLFCIDELPVLDTRKQVSLLSVLQEGKFTTGSYPVIFEPKTVFVATANPIDYTHSGKIIEPLYDRLKSHIQTHYPKSLLDEIAIMIQEVALFNSFLPEFLLKILAQTIQNARSSPEINQDKGVSVRTGIHSLEVLSSEAERTRAISHDIMAIPRPSDLYSIGQSVKFELAELDDVLENRTKVLQNLLSNSIKSISLEYLSGIEQSLIESIKSEFSGKTFQVSQAIMWSNQMESSYENQLKNFNILTSLVDTVYQKVVSAHEHLGSDIQKLGVSNRLITIAPNVKSELKASVLELILEGLCYTEPKILDRKDGAYVSI